MGEIFFEEWYHYVNYNNLYKCGKKIHSIKNYFKNIHYTHPPLHTLLLFFSLRARPLYILSFSKCKSQKSIHTAFFCSRICTYNYRDSSYFSYYHRKVQPLVTNLLREIFFFFCLYRWKHRYCTILLHLLKQYSIIISVTNR